MRSFHWKYPLLLVGGHKDLCQYESICTMFDLICKVDNTYIKLGNTDWNVKCVCVCSYVRVSIDTAISGSNSNSNLVSKKKSQEHHHEDQQANAHDDDDDDDDDVQSIPQFRAFENSIPRSPGLNIASSTIHHTHTHSQRWPLFLCRPRLTKLSHNCQGQS